MAFGIFGLAIIIYGWFNRYRMTIYYPGGKIRLRGGSKVYDLMIQLREALLRAKHIKIQLVTSHYYEMSIIL